MANPTNPPTGPSRADLDLLGQQSALYAEMSTSVKALADSINKIVGAVRGTTGEVEDLSNGLAAMAEAAVSGTNDIATATNNAISSSEEGAQKAKATIQGLTTVSEEAGNALTRMAKQLALDEATTSLWETKDTLEFLSKTAQGFGENLEGAFSAANAKVVSLVSGVGALAEGLFNIGKAVFAIPFQLFSLAAEEGNNLLNKGGGDNSFQLALEDIREQFGNIATNEGKAVVDMYKDINSQQKNVAGSGLSMSKIFGKSSEALKAMGDVAKGLGAQFGILKEQLADSAAEVAVFQKGMGLSNEDLQAFGAMAISSGKPLVGFLKEAGKQSVLLGKQFGINSNLIGKDLAYMASNASKFGKMTMQAMGTAATYARKLGLEIKDLEGVMGVFDDFESGAQASAKLSQAFGVQIDSMKMMQASSPAEQVSMLRDAFAKSGKSLEGLTRQQRKYLADTTGLGDKLEQALSPANAGAKLGDIQDAATKAAADTNDQLLTQNNLIKALATNIKKLPKEGGGGGGDEKNKWTSFIDAFKDGFRDGLKDMKSYQRMVRSIAGSMNELHDIGKNVFNTFIKSFPQLGEIFGGLSRIFDPKRFKLEGDKLVKIFSSLFEGLKNPATASKAFGDFYDSFIKWFKGIFSDEDSKQAVFGGIEQLVGYMGNALSGFVEFLVPKIADMINAIADFIANPSGAASKIAGAAQTGIGGAFAKALGQIGTAIEKSWPVLKEALIKLVDLALEAIKPYLLKALGIYFGYIYATGIVGGFAKAAGSALLEVGMRNFDKIMKLKMQKLQLKIMGGSPLEKAAVENKEAAVAGGKQAADAKAAVDAGAPAAESKGIMKSLADIDKGDIRKAGENVLLMSLYFIGSMLLLIAGLGAIGGLVMLIGPEALITGLVAVGSVITALIGVALLTKLLDKVDPKKAASVLKESLPLALIAGGLLTGFVVIAGLAAKMNVTPELAMALGLVMVGIVAALTLIAIAAYALMAIAPDGGLSAAASLVIVGTVLLVALGVFALGVFKFMEIGPDPSQLKRAEDVMNSIAMIIGYVVAMVGAALLVGLALLNPMTLYPIVAGVVAIGGFLVLIGPAIEKIVKAFEGVKMDPEAVEQKINILKNVFALLDPMFKMIEKVMDQSSSWATGTDTAAQNVKTQLDSISNFIDTILESLGTFVNTVIAASQTVTVSDDEIKRAEIFGKILGPVSELIGALMGSISGIETNAEESDLTSYKAAVTMSSQLDAIKGFLLGEGGLLKSITRELPDIVKSINDITVLKGMSPKELETLGKKAELVGTMVSAITSLVGTFSDVAKSAASIGATKTVEEGFINDVVTESVEMQKITDFLPTFTTIFNNVKALIPALVESFNGLPAIDLKGSKDPTERIKGISDAIDAMMSGINNITKMFPGMKTEDLKKMDEELTAKLTSTKNVISSAGDIMKSILTKFTELPALDVVKLGGLNEGLGLIGNIGEYASDIEAATKALDTFTKAQLTTSIGDTVKAINTIDAQLASLDRINMHARFEKVGKALALKPDSLKIENKPVNINIQLNFTMDAKDLAMEITNMQSRIKVLSPNGQANARTK